MPDVGRRLRARHRTCTSGSISPRRCRSGQHRSRSGGPRRGQMSRSGRSGASGRSGPPSRASSGARRRRSEAGRFASASTRFRDPVARRAALQDRHRATTDVVLDADLVAMLRRNARLAVARDTSQIEVRDDRHLRHGRRIGPSLRSGEAAQTATPCSARCRSVSRARPGSWMTGAGSNAGYGDRLRAGRDLELLHHLGARHLRHDALDLVEDVPWQDEIAPGVFPDRLVVVQ